MQIVIELADETYKDIKEENGIYGINNGLSARITGKVVGAIQSGTPLPKGHGTETEWIPVSERLPKEEGSYMTTLDYGEYGLSAGQRYYHGEDYGWSDVCVIAWMPLPEPYRAESEDRK